MAGDVNLFFNDPDDHSVAEIEIMIAGTYWGGTCPPFPENKGWEWNGCWALLHILKGRKGGSYITALNNFLQIQSFSWPLASRNSLSELLFQKISRGVKRWGRRVGTKYVLKFGGHLCIMYGLAFWDLILSS